MTSHAKNPHAIAAEDWTPWPEEFAHTYREAGYWTGETFPAFLRERATRFAEHTAVVDGTTLSYNAADRILDLRHLKPSSAEVRPPQYEGGHPVVWICTTPEGGKLLHAWTSQHVGQQLGVFVDGRLISAPHIMSAIDECVILDGGFTQEEAEAVAAKVKGSA